MSDRSWHTALRQALRKARRPDQQPRVAVVGVGHELRGDDAVGVDIARQLHSLPARPGWLILEVGPVPERCTGPLRRFQPDLVVLVDAVQMAEPPGSVRWFDTWLAADRGVFSHGLPLDLLAAYLRAELDCAVGMLGIQPAADDVDTPVSRRVRHAAAAVVAELAAGG